MKCLLKLRQGLAEFRGLISGCVLGLAPSISKRSRIIGIFAIFCNILMYWSPLTIIVYQTKSVEFMPFWLSVAGALNGACWFVYGLLQFDINLVVPNGLGLLSGLIQLIIYGLYFKKTPKSDTKKPAKSEIHLQGNIV